MAGIFDRTFAVWRKELTPDGGGGFSEEEVKVADIEGRAWPTRLTDTVIGARRAGEIIWTFATHPEADVKEGDELRFEGRVLLVNAVAITSTRRRLQAQCEEIR